MTKSIAKDYSKSQRTVKLENRAKENWIACVSFLHVELITNQYRYYSHDYSIIRNNSCKSFILFEILKLEDNILPDYTIDPILMIYSHDVYFSFPFFFCSSRIWLDDSQKFRLKSFSFFDIVNYVSKNKTLKDYPL